MSLTRALAHNTGIQLLGRLISTALGVVIVGLMTRLLGAAGFGAYSTANAFLQIFALLLDLGLNVTMVAMLGEHAGDEAYEKRCISALFTFRLVTGLILIGLIAPAIGWLSPYPIAIKLAIVALTGSFFFPALGQIVTGVQQRHFKMHIAAMGDVLGRMTLLIGLLLAPSLGWGLVPIVWFISLGGFSNFVLNFWLTRRMVPFKWNWDPEFWRIALKRSWAVGVSIAFGLVYFKADTLILSFVRTQVEVGWYGAAYRVLEILITVPFMYAGLVLPIFAQRFSSGKFQDFAKLVSQSIDAMMLLVAPMIIGTEIMGTKIMVLVAGPEFAIAGDIMRVLILAVGVIYLNTIFSHAVVAVNAQRKMIPIYIVVAIATLGGYLFYIPTYGVWAAAWLTVASETAIGIGSLVVTNRLAKIPFHPRASLAAIASALVMGVVVWLLRDAWLGLPIFIGALIYVICIVLFGAVSKETLREILSLQKNKNISPTT